MATLTTRIFKNGNSQAVRIPQEFRLDVTQVEISRCPNGDLLIHPLPADRGAALLAVLQGFDDDFAEHLLEDALEPAPMQDRAPL
ncbi:antitoxin [Methylomonas koyamae]|uniref:antitoxin n=1 Tax=Methylomonas koyamae TaxID=702114 RepID=UPI002872E63A|nr:AbrB/MazE/SpoVT family DNA-binding domain-containing protein [Methylomonas koyamae]WNB74034.1 AbrB/MazE/SpoVT family DNA-binding domain-containing protein [Methylomonas koyamae]